MVGCRTTHMNTRAIAGSRAIAPGVFVAALNQIIERLHDSSNAVRYGIEQLPESAEQLSCCARAVHGHVRSRNIHLCDEQVHINWGEIERHDVAMTEAGARYIYGRCEILRNDVSTEYAARQLQHSFGLHADHLTHDILDDGKVLDHRLFDGHISKVRPEQ